MQVQGSPIGEIAADTRMRCPACLAVFRTGFDCCPVDGAAIAPCEAGFDPLLGSELAGRYVIEELVGEGSMGLIYRARHACLPRSFAVKILFGDLVADPRMRIRFAQEAALASRLSHPNVVPVVDFGRSEQGLLFLVMDFIHGEGLGDLMARHAPLDSLHVVALARQLAQGLGHAHRRGLVHRDFKPNNVLLEPQEDGPPVPRILDFGLAISTRDRDELPGRLTECGFILGTPVYIAPEQVLDHGVDHRADLFALGVVMYEMLAAQPPFDGRPIEIAHKNVIAPVPPIAERSPGVSVPPALEAVVRRLLEKAPDARFSTADELCAALDEVERGLMAQAPAMAMVSPRPVFVPAPAPASAVHGAAPRMVARLRSRLSRAHGLRSRVSRVSTALSGRLAVAGVLLFAAATAAYALVHRPASGRTAQATAAPSPQAAALSAPSPQASAQPASQPLATPAVASAGLRAVGARPPGDARASDAQAVSQARAAQPASRETAAAATPRVASAAHTLTPPRVIPRAPVSRGGGDLSGRAEKAASNEATADPELLAAAIAGTPMGAPRADPSRCRLGDCAGRAAIAAREVSARARDGAGQPSMFGVAQPAASPAPAASAPAAQPPARQIAQPAAPAAAPRARGPIVVPAQRAQRESGSLRPIQMPRDEKVPGQLTAKLCVDTHGSVSSVMVLTPVSAAVRERLERALSRWRYRPVVDGGAAVAACFATVFRVQVE
jgi:eukaryotic-like serine/threonine-protein kinase